MQKFVCRWTSLRVYWHKSFLSIETVGGSKSWTMKISFSIVEHVMLQAIFPGTARQQDKRDFIKELGGMELNQSIIWSVKKMIQRIHLMRLKSKQQSQQELISLRKKQQLKFYKTLRKNKKRKTPRSQEQLQQGTFYLRERKKYRHKQYLWALQNLPRPPLHL